MNKSICMCDDCKKEGKKPFCKDYGECLYPEGPCFTVDVPKYEKYQVKGSCGTYTIEVYDDYATVHVGNIIRRYKNFENAKWAIRIMERRYVEKNPNTPVRNRDIWCDHGILWVEDFDGIYKII